MSEPITVPTPTEITERIRAGREELAALRRLQRMAKAAQAAHQARAKRTGREGVPYAS
jgi:hypothetical protein